MLDKIARIQDKIGKLTKDTKGYNYKYFDINQLLEKLQPLLREEGLVITQPVLNGHVCTMIQDADKPTDELISSIKLPENVKPQDLGSAITYYRRYSLVSLLALEAEDDDGAKAQKAPSVAPEEGAGISTKDFAQIRDNYANNNVPPPIDKWEDMNLEQRRIINQIKLTNKK